MTELTPQQRQERARRAKMAMEEFFNPALSEIEKDYAEKIIGVSASTDPRQPEIVTRLGIGVQVCRQIKALVEAHIADGEVAAREIARGERIQSMTPAKGRLLNIAPN